jgi:hypothetical protein
MPKHWVVAPVQRTLGPVIVMSMAVVMGSIIQYVIIYIFTVKYCIKSTMLCFVFFYTFFALYFKAKMVVSKILENVALDYSLISSPLCDILHFSTIQYLLHLLELG